MFRADARAFSVRESLFFGWQVDSLSHCVPRRNDHLSPTVEGWQTCWACPTRAQASVRIPANLLRECIRLFQGPFHVCLCPSQRTRRSIFFELQIKCSERQRTILPLPCS